jgi:hypothetical protein
MRKGDAKLVAPSATAFRLFDLSGIEYLKIKRDRVFYKKMSEGRWRDVLGWDHEGCEVKASYDYFSQVGRLAFRGCNSSE